MSTKGISYSALGTALGISKPMVCKLVKAGMPTSSVEAARAWRTASLDVSRTKAARAVMTPHAEPTAADHGKLPDDDDQAAPVDDEAYKRARTEREQIRRDRERIELQREQGLVVDVAEVVRLRFTEFRALRDALGNRATRTAPMLAVESDPIACERLVQEALNAVLSDFSTQVLARAVTQDVDEDDDDAD